MKKMLLAAVGLAGVLASCGGASITVGNGFYNGYGTSSSLRLNGLSDLRTNWQLSADVRDQQGRTIPAGSYVICDNGNTTLEFDVAWSGGLSKLGVQYAGLTTGDYRNLSVYPYSSVDYSGAGTVTTTIGAGMAPLSIKKQDIIVNPVTNVSVRGYTYVNAQGLDGQGLASNVVTSSTAIPVLDCR